MMEPKVIQRLMFIRTDQDGIAWRTDFCCAH